MGVTEKDDHYWGIFVQPQPNHEKTLRPEEEILQNNSLKRSDHERLVKISNCHRSGKDWGGDC